MSVADRFITKSEFDTFVQNLGIDSWRESIVAAPEPIELFTLLFDTPVSYLDSAAKFVQVNAAEDALEFNLVTAEDVQPGTFPNGNFKYGGDVWLGNDGDELQLGDAANDYTIQWDGNDAVHTVVAGDFKFMGGMLGVGTVPAWDVHIYDATGAYAVVDAPANQEVGFGWFKAGSAKWQALVETSDSDLKFFEGVAGVKVAFVSGGHLHLPNDSAEIRLGQEVNDYTIQWNSNDAVHTIVAGDFVFLGGMFGVGLIPLQKFEIGSADNSNRVSIYHDNTDSYFKVDDGQFIFQTDEGTNTRTEVALKPKGTHGSIIFLHGFGDFGAWQQGDGWTAFESGAAVPLLINPNNQQDARFFSSSGANPSVEIWGMNTAAGTDVYTSLIMSDVNDEFLIQPQNTGNHEGITIDLLEAAQRFRFRQGGENISLYFDGSNFIHAISSGDYNFTGGEYTFDEVVTGIDPTLPAHLATKEYVDLAINVQFDYFFNNTPHDIAGIYYNMRNFESGEAEATFTIGPLAGGDGQALVNFANIFGEPGVTSLPPGLYSSHIHAQRTIGNRSVELYFELYKRTDPGGVETLLMTSEVSGPIVAKTGVNLHAAVPSDIELDPTDILVIKWYANLGGGAPTTIALYAEGANDSHLTIPVESSIFNQIYVRQDGTTPLTGNWDVGNFDLTMKNITIDGTFTDGTMSIVGGALSAVTTIQTSSWVHLDADSAELRLGAETNDYTIQWDGNDAVHTIVAGDFVFTGGRLEVGGDTGELLRLVDSSATGNPLLSFYQTTTRKAYFQYVDSSELFLIDSDGTFQINTNNSQAVFIDTSGNVGIGGTPLEDLHVSVAGNNEGVRISSGVSVPRLDFYQLAEANADARNWGIYGNSSVYGELAFRVSVDNQGTTQPSTITFSLRHDGGIYMPGLKSGINQGAAGAAAGELWFDTDDDNTVKMGV